MSIIANVNIRDTGLQSRDTAESVRDAIVDMAPMETPLIAMMPRGANPGNIKYEWPLDSSGAFPATTSGLVRGEGEDANPAATDLRPLLFNRTHIHGRSWSTTHTQEVVRKYGIESEFDYQAVKEGRKLVRDFEFLLHYSTVNSDTTGPHTGSAGNKRRMGGLRQIIDDISGGGTSFLSEGTISTVAQSYSVAASSPTTAISDILGVQGTMWDRGGNPNGYSYVLCHRTDKNTVSDAFSPNGSGSATTIYRRYAGADDFTWSLPVDRVITDQGELYLVLDRSMKQGDLIFFDPEFFELNALRDFEVIELAKTGPSKHGMVEGELTCSLIAPNTAALLTSF